MINIRIYRKSMKVRVVKVEAIVNGNIVASEDVGTIKTSADGYAAHAVDGTLVTYRHKATYIALAMDLIAYAARVEEAT